jgi:hypothetical protein
MIRVTDSTFSNKTYFEELRVLGCWLTHFSAHGFFCLENGGGTVLRNVATSQNAAFFIVTAAKTSNSTGLTFLQRFIKRPFQQEIYIDSDDR